MFEKVKTFLEEVKEDQNDKNDCEDSCNENRFLNEKLKNSI